MLSLRVADRVAIPRFPQGATGTVVRVTGPAADRSRTPPTGPAYVAAPVGRRAGRSIGAGCLAAVTSCLVALVLAGVLPGAVADGLRDAGAPSRWALPVVSLLTHLAALGTVGSVLVGSVLLRARPTGELSELARRAVTKAGPWATAWALLTAGQLLLTASVIAAVPLTRLDTDILAAVVTSGQGRALVVAALLAAAVAATAGRARSATDGRLLLVVAVVGLLPPTLTGHASSAVDHDVAASALVVHVVAATLWTGGLVGLVQHLRPSPLALAAAVPRFSAVALAAYVALAGSGVLAVSTRLDMSLDPWRSDYGVLVMAKVAALVVLGAIGYGHRRRVLPRLVSASGQGPFLRLAAVELVGMGVAMGLAAALSRTPVPPAAGAVQPTHGTGHPTLPGVVERVSASGLATAWRPNAIVLVVVGLALAAYVLAVRAVRRQGGTWHRGRTAAFVCGLLVAVVDLCSGVATYAPAMVSVQVTQLLIALLVVPALLLLGAPGTLWTQSGWGTLSGVAPRTWWRRKARASSPLTGAAACSTLLLTVYRTPLIEASQRDFWTHMAVMVLAVVAGLLLLWPALGPASSGSDGIETAGEWTWCMVGVAGCLGLLAAQLRYGDRLLAAEWFLELRWSWVDPVADQRLAGAVAAAAAVAVLILGLVLTRVLGPLSARRGQ